MKENIYNAGYYYTYQIHISIVSKLENKLFLVLIYMDSYTEYIIKLLHIFSYIYILTGSTLAIYILV